MSVACWSLAVVLTGLLAAPPNIVVILADDVRWDDLGCSGHPFSRTPHLDRLAHEGARFRQAFAVTPLCSPSRASFLTGLYPHAHGIIDNTDRSPASHRLATFPIMLQQAGYETAFVGKWHMGNDDRRRPGFDHWVCLAGQGSSFDADLNVNGQPTKSTGHVTDVLTEQAVRFLRQPRSRPFLLYLAHKAVHPETVQRADGTLSDPSASTFVPARRHERLYEGQKPPRRANVTAPLDKPALQRPIAGLPPLGPATGSSDESILGRLRMLAGIDNSTGKIFDALSQVGQLDNSVVIFTSDHGYFYGEHGLSVERRLAYEEAIRIPLFVRFPPRIKAGAICDQMVLSIDLAPTLLNLAGVAASNTMHGRSFAAVFAQADMTLRSSFLLEHFSDAVFPRTRQLGYQAVRTQRWKYIHYIDLPNADELYDLQADPYELRNRINDPLATPDLQQLQAELHRLLQATGAPPRP